MHRREYNHVFFWKISDKIEIWYWIRSGSRAFLRFRSWFVSIFDYKFPKCFGINLLLRYDSARRLGWTLLYDVLSVLRGQVSLAILEFCWRKISSKKIATTFKFASKFSILIFHQIFTQISIFLQCPKFWFWIRLLERCLHVVYHWQYFLCSELAVVVG